MQKDSHEAYGTMPDQENAGTGKIPSKDRMNVCPLIIRAELFGPILFTAPAVKQNVTCRVDG
jgi:hypothetical protein